MTADHRTLWFDPSFGASGDMLLGVLVGLGVPLPAIVDELEPLAVDGWSMTESAVSRGSLSATRVEVTGDDDGGHGHRSWSSIDRMLVASPLPGPVVDGARRTFRMLAEAEASIHQVDIDAVHFHEVGAVDAIVDIVGVWSALERLDVDRIVCGPVGLGHGTVDAAHGPLPLPAPATAELLRSLPVRGLDLDGETVTPTGAALLATIADDFGPIPTGTLAATARGAGGRDPASHPNVLSAYLVVGTTDPEPRDLAVSQATLIQTNLDDTTGEVVAHTIERCLELGADDAWAHPIVMKKGRPGVELNVLAGNDRVAVLRDTILVETATLGVRITTVMKQAQPRRFETVDIDGHTIRIKIGPAGAKPEFDDLAAAARALSLPLPEVSRRALQLHGGSVDGANDND